MRPEQKQILDMILQDIQEIKSDVKEVQREMNSLKVKVAGVASFIGAFTAAIINKIMGNP